MGEISLKAFGAEISGNVRWVDPFTRFVDGISVKVGGKYLQGESTLGLNFGKRFLKYYG